MRLTKSPFGYNCYFGLKQFNSDYKYRERKWREKAKKYILSTLHLHFICLHIFNFDVLFKIFIHFSYCYFWKVLSLNLHFSLNIIDTNEILSQFLASEHIMNLYSYSYQWVFCLLLLSSYSLASFFQLDEIPLRFPIKQVWWRWVLSAFVFLEVSVSFPLLFQNDLFIWKRDRETDSSILWCAPQMTAMALDWASLKLEARSFFWISRWDQGSKHLGPLYCFPKCFNKELDQKWQ